MAYPKKAARNVGHQDRGFHVQRSVPPPDWFRLPFLARALLVAILDVAVTIRIVLDRWSVRVAKGSP